MSDNSQRATDQRGFTLVEVTIAIAVGAAIAIVYLSVVANFLVTMNRNNQLVEMTLSSQNLLRSTVENIRYGDGVRQTNQIVDPNATGGWNTTNSNFVIILAVPAVTQAGEFIIDDDTGSPYMNELVYYKKNNSLMRRTLAHPDAVGNKMVRSCPPENFTATCPSDNTLAPYVTSMLFTLYDQNGAQTTNTDAARSVKIDLTMTRGSFEKPITVDNSIRVTLRNRF